MKYLFSLIFLLLLTNSWAQPANDDCSGVIDLGIAPVCPETIYTNVNATPTDIGDDNDPDCFATNPPSNDVWFQFTTDAMIVDYTVSVTATDAGVNADALSNIQFAIYRGFCGPNSLFINNCAIGGVNDGVVSLDLINLTPNEVYYIRVDNYSDNVAEGDFKLCIEEKEEVTIDEGFSNACSGTLYDSGGPDANYSDNEDYVFTICPQEFNQCIEFNLEYYNIESEGFDNMIFYNGPDINSPIISQLTEPFGGSVGGGAVCYNVKADTCLTIQFISDGASNFEGFKGDWLCSVNPCVQDQALTVDIGTTKEAIENAISTPTAQVTVDTIICDSLSYGTFSMGGNTDLGLQKGLVLSSGQAQDASGAGSDFASSPIGPFDVDDSDGDLDILSDLFGDGAASNDACVVEVDVTVFANELNFEYIFGSEEYPEFVDQFNDIFALLISGPGITGIPEINNQQNMAVVPGTTTPIAINDVNNEDNWQYYRNNAEGNSIVYDGLTSGFLGNKKSLTATAIVQPCSTYHLKFAIADRGDTAFDSGVFISEIRSGTPMISTQFTSGLDYFVEKCLSSSNDTIIISLDEAATEEATYTVVVGGTATSPDDYVTDLSDEITFVVGQTEAKFAIEVFNDDITEGDETVLIELYRDFGCGEILITSTEVFIRENILVTIDTPSDSIVTCDGAFTMLEAEGATSYIWSPFNVFDNPFISNPTVEAGYEGWVYVEGKIDPFTSPECVGLDSVYINLVEPMVEIQTDDPTQFCQGDTITMTAINNVNDSNVTWSVINQFTNVESPNSATTDYIPPFGITNFDFQVVVQVEIAGCTASDTLVINVDPYTNLDPIFQDTTVCQNETFPINNFGFNFTQTTFDISPTDFWEDPNDPFSTVTPQESIDYQIISSSAGGFCTDTFNYSIEVLPNEINILEGDELRICLGEEIVLTTEYLPANGNITWTPTDSLLNTGDGNAIVNPSVTTDYIVYLTNGICDDADTIRVYVDSLPDMSITAIPVRDPYCQGEVVTLVSPGYKNYQFPNIEHKWEPGPQNEEVSLDTDYNIVISADVNRPMYIRTTENGACEVMDTFEMNVIDPSIEINLNDTMVCRGESLDLAITANGELEEIQWDSDSGSFTCDDCEETTLNNLDANTTVSVEAEVDGCPTSESIQVEVIKYAGNIQIEPDTTCNFYGDILDLTANFSTEPAPGFQLEWFRDGNAIPEFNNQNPITITLPGDDGSTQGETNIEYSWKITDVMGCMDETERLICVKNRFDVPDAFSPGNNDGVNDVFRIVDFGIGRSSVEILDFSVYNRWGQRVYSCEDFECATDTGWDGTYNDVVQPGGTYVFNIEIRFSDGTTRSWKGDLLLMR